MKNVTNGTLVVLMTATFLGGCPSGADDEGDPEFAALQPRDPMMFQNEFTAAPYGVGSCDARDGKLRGQRELRVFNAGNYDPGTFTRALSRYYARHDLTFFTRHPTFNLTMPYAIESNEERLEAALRKRFPKVDFDNEEFLVTEDELAKIESFVANLVLQPVLDFVKKFGHQDPSVTNVILLNEVASTELLEEKNTILAGLSISPQLIKTLGESKDDDAAIWRGVDLPESFNAMVFVNAKYLSDAKHAGVVDLVMAHEFGHSAGLVHAEATSNLMKPTTILSTASCTDSLTDSQLAAMAQNLGVGNQPQTQPLTVSATPKALAKGGAAGAPQTRWNKLRRDTVGQDASAARFLRDLLDPHHNKDEAAR